MRIKEINLDDLKRQYLRRSGVADAIELLNDAGIFRGAAEITARALRHPSPPLIDREQIRVRRTFDDLLSFYGAMEIACLIKFVPNPLPEDFRQFALSHLHQPDLKIYLEHYYPCILPKQLRDRIEGKRSEYIEDTDETTALFMRFLEMTRILEEDEQFQVFRRVLYGADDDCTPEDTLRAFENLRSFQSHIERPPSEQGILEYSIHGLLTFLIFCCNFDALLEQTQPYMQLQSAMWQYHSSFLDSSDHRLDDFLDTVVDRFRHWNTADQVDLSAADENEEDLGVAMAETERSIEELQQALRRLRSGVYSGVEFGKSADKPNVSAHSDSFDEAMMDDDAIAFAKASDFVRDRSPAEQVHVLGLSDAQCLRIMRYAEAVITRLGERTLGRDSRDLLDLAVAAVVSGPQLTSSMSFYEGLLTAIRGLALSWSEEAAKSNDRIWEAAYALTQEQLVRLKEFAQWRMRVVGRKALGRNAEDLVSEALVSTLEGRRVWNEEVDFYRHLLGAIRSISSRWRGTAVEEYPQSQLSNEPGQGPIESVATNVDPERILGAKERLEQVKKLFETDSLASQVVALFGLGYTAKEVQKELAISAREYGAAAKRIRRKLDSWQQGAA
jgi:DNA-directed RNA polymerase specialized sigma24 family protein